ncbi:hypothetical protein AAD018_009380 [Aestuariibius insulae]|uniref:hypothetical protein n=1 Tax=Aestuariibius insulae TaxID=2058287 RepID=UPI00398EA159
MNTDQSSKFTSIELIKTLKDADIQISIDGKGAWRDNIFAERLWRGQRPDKAYLNSSSPILVPA